MKVKSYFYVFYVIALTSMLYSGCADYPAYEITSLPFVNKTSLEMYIGREEQLFASPITKNFTWSSNNESVASVSQTGLIKALAEGLATITVASSDDRATVDVRVREYVPVTDITMVASLSMFTGESTQVWAYPVPDNASELTVTWRSENPAVATVDKNGIVTAVSRGVTDIIASAGGIEKSVIVTVTELYKYPKGEWTAESRNGNHNWTGDGGNVVGAGQPWCVLDDDKTTGWHSKVGAQLPQCLVVDMKASLPVDRITIWHVTNGLQNGWIYYRHIEVYLTDTPATPNVYQESWGSPAATFEYSTSMGDPVTLDLKQGSKGQYMILLFPDSSSSTYISFGELDVYVIR